MSIGASINSETAAIATLSEHHRLLFYLLPGYFMHLFYTKITPAHTGAQHNATRWNFSTASASLLVIFRLSKNSTKLAFVVLLYDYEKQLSKIIMYVKSNTSTMKISEPFL